MHSESQSYNDTVHYSHPSPFAEASLHFLIAFVLIEINLHRVPSRDMNSGPASNRATLTLMNYAAPLWTTLHPNELRCTLMNYDAP